MEPMDFLTRPDGPEEPAVRDAAIIGRALYRLVYRAASDAVDARLRQLLAGEPVAEAPPPLFETNNAVPRITEVDTVTAAELAEHLAVAIAALQAVHATLLRQLDADAAQADDAA